MSAVETRARIITAARDLFNGEGYTGLSAVDVANAIGISPGHLYYHFKGKAEIAAVLLDEHIDELAAITSHGLGQLAGEAASLEALWTHVHILIEEVQDTRFIWREGRALWASDPKLAALIHQAAGSIHRFAQTALLALRNAGAIRLSDEALDGFAAQMALGITLQATWLEIALGNEADQRALAARAAGLVMLPLTALAP
jgi:AcrR family transcriptional regulator